MRVGTRQTLGGRFGMVELCRFMVQPTTEIAAYDRYRNAPSRGEGRARPGLVACSKWLGGGKPQGPRKLVVPKVRRMRTLLFAPIRSGYSPVDALIGKVGLGYISTMVEEDFSPDFT